MTATYMDILFPEFFGQALAEGPQAVLSSSKCTGINIASDTCGSACKYQGSTSTLLIDLVILECQNCLTREGESGDNVILNRVVDIFFRDL